MTARGPAQEEAALRYLTRRAADLEAWEPLSLCKEIGTRLFYPELVEGTVHKESPDDAVRVCGLCPVMAECRARALVTQERLGVWGGMTEQARKRVLASPDLIRRALLAALDGEPPSVGRKKRKTPTTDRAETEELEAA